MKRTIMLGSVAIVATLALLLSATSSLGQGADMDADGVPDDQDNCILVPNGPLLGLSDVSSPSYVPQQDGDDDGYGNACEADFNNDGGSFGLDDISSMLNAMNNSQHPAEMDINSDGGVGLDDFSHAWNEMLAQLPGPSGLACAAANQKGTCPPEWP